MAERLRVERLSFWKHTEQGLKAAWVRERGGAALLQVFLELEDPEAPEFLDDRTRRCIQLGAPAHTFVLNGRGELFRWSRLQLHRNTLDSR